jgi:hypothetical protein
VAAAVLQLIATFNVSFHLWELTAALEDLHS